jgi:anti-sigma B factor antagonist
VAQLTIVTEHANGEAVLRVAGALDLAGGDLLEEAVSPFLGTTERVVVDLSDVQFIDSSGLGALIAVHQQAVDAGGELTLRAPSDPVRRVLDITQTAPVFEVDGAG